MHIIRTGVLGVNSLIVPLSGNKVFVIDPAACRFSRDEKAISQYLEQNKLEPVAFIFTHGHFDHISGLSFLHSVYPEAAVAIHKNDAAMIGRNSQDFQETVLSQMGIEVFLPSVSNLPDPTNFLEDKQTLSDILPQFTEQELKESLSNWLVIHTPGHTPGCTCLYNKKEKILISGDTLFYHSWGRTDLYGGNEQEIHRSLQKLAEIVDDDALVYPGHETTGFMFKDRF